MSRLGESVARASRLLEKSDLADDDVVAETSARRSLDLSDLTPHEQAKMITVSGMSPPRWATRRAEATTLHSSPTLTSPANLATYQARVSAFIDFQRAELLDPRDPSPGKRGR